VNYRILLAREAEKILDRVDKRTALRIGARLNQLAIDPFDSRLSSPLTERPGVRKSRVGGWRILFTANRDELTIFVLAIDTRGQVYKHSS
jgi:mRNA interferase RelE/StbE